jgi:hypothetical protein
MKKTLFVYGVLVFLGGLMGGALTDAVCRLRPAGAVSQSGGAVMNAAAPAERRVVTASELVLTGLDGKQRLKMDVSDDGRAEFAMYDRDNHPRAQVVVDTYGSPSVRLYDVYNKLRLALEIGTDGIPTVRLLDTSERAREVLGIDAEGEAGINFYAQDGRVLRELP